MMQTADDVMVQAYLWMATASSLAAAAWVARRKLFGEDTVRDASSDKPHAHTPSPSRRLSAEWDDESSLMDYSDDDNSFVSDSYDQRSPVDGHRRSRTPPSSSASRAPHTPSSSVRFAERVEFSPAAESVLGSPRPSSDTTTVESILMKVVDHLDQTAAHALKTFYKYDSDGSGTLSVAQLTSVLAELGLRTELDDVRALADHVGVLGGGSILDGEVLSIKGFLRALKQARNERRAAEGVKHPAPAPTSAAPAQTSATVTAPAPAPASELVAAAPAPSLPATEGAFDSPKSADKLQNKVPANEASDELQEQEAQVQKAALEKKRAADSMETAERTAWAAATTRDGKPSGLRSTSRPRPRSQEAELANTRRALDHYETGCEHLDDGNWTAAEAELRRALTLQPKFPDCQRRLAALKRKQGEDAALNTRQSTLGFTPQIERKPHAIARGRLATPHDVSGPTISSSRKAVGNLVATGRVVPASAPGARRRRAHSPRTRDEHSLHDEPPSTALGHRMEQLKEDRAKEEVVQRLYDWESSKKVRIEEAQHAATPAFTPQPYASTRRSEYDRAELDELEAGPSLIDRCSEWSHNREEWLKAKQDEQLRDLRRHNKRATEEDADGSGPATFPTPKRYQRKAEAWASSLDFVSRMAEADREKQEKLDDIRREKLAAQQAEEEKHLVHARKVVATKEEGEQIAERLFRWEAEKQSVLNDVRKEIQAEQTVDPKPRLDDASRALIDNFDTSVPVTDRLLLWHEVHNQQLEQKRVQTLTEDEAELTFKPKLGKTAQKVRSNRPLSKDSVFETLHDEGSSSPRASKTKASDSTNGKIAREQARTELRAQLEGLTFSLLKKRADAVGVSVDAMLGAMKAAVRLRLIRADVASYSYPVARGFTGSLDNLNAAVELAEQEDDRIPRHAARGEHGWRGSIEHIAEEKNAVITAILDKEAIPHSRSFNKNARGGRGGFLSGPARNTPSSNSRRKSNNGKDGQRRAASTGPAPRVASLSPTRGRRRRPASTDRRKSPQQVRQIKSPADKHAGDRVHFMRFNSAEKQRQIHGGPEISDDGKPLSLPGTPTRTSPGLASFRAASEAEGVGDQSCQRQSSHAIGSRLNKTAHTQAQVLRLTDEEKREREVDNIFRVIRQEMDAHKDRSLYGRKLGDARRTFGLMDRDGNGFLSREEFAEGLKRLDFGITEKQLAEVLDIVDTDGNGTVEYDEFLARLQKGANDGQVKRLHLEDSAVNATVKGKGAAEMNAKDTQRYFDERHAQAQAKKQARRQEQSAKKAASSANGRVKTTARPKGAANPLLKTKPNERLAQLSRPRSQPAANDETNVSSTRKEPLSPGHVPRTAAPRHRVRRPSPRRSADHHGCDAAQAVSPDSTAGGNTTAGQEKSVAADRGRAAALEAAHNALLQSGLGATLEKSSGGSTAKDTGLPPAGGAGASVGLLEARNKGGQQASGWTLDSFH